MSNYKRATSRGNPYHDKLGRFTHGPTGGKAWQESDDEGAKRCDDAIKSEKTKEEYQDRTNTRLAEEAYERGEQALGKPKSAYATKEEYVEAKKKYYEQIDDEENATRDKFVNGYDEEYSHEEACKEAYAKGELSYEGLKRYLDEKEKFDMWTTPKPDDETLGRMNVHAKNDFNGYDKTVAEAHMGNYGVIVTNSNGNPIDDEHELLQISRAHTQVAGEVSVAIKDGKRMPAYQDDVRTAMKLKILNDKLGDDEKTAKKRAKERFTVKMLNGDVRECKEARVHIDGAGTMHIEATADDGNKINIPLEIYENREVK